MSASLNGSVHWNQTSIRSALNPTVSLGIESLVGVQLGPSGVASSANSDILLLASIPGQLTLTKPSPDTSAPHHPMAHLEWTAAPGAARHIFLHKSHCSSSAGRQCPHWLDSGNRNWEDLIATAAGSWMLKEDRMAWFLARLSHVWMPGPAPAAAGSDQLAWSRAAGHPDAIRLSLQQTATTTTGERHKFRPPFLMMVPL